ncbi:transcriptional regulator GutM [Shigella flexneri]
MVSALITVAVIAWCAQLALGGWQISCFNRAFDTLCRARAGWRGPFQRALKPRVVVAIALDDQQRIVDTLFMKGLTVFARPQKFPQLPVCMSVIYSPMVIFPHDPSINRTLIIRRLN